MTFTVPHYNWLLFITTSFVTKVHMMLMRINMQKESLVEKIAWLRKD